MSPNAAGPSALRLLVAGGMGFIGSNFVRHALRTRRHWTILNLDRLTYAGNPANLADVGAAEGARYRFVRGDIADAALVAQHLHEDVDVVINFAAESHVDRSILDSSPFLHTNVVGTEVLLNAARRAGIRQFVQVSTDEVYGPAPPHGAFSEEEPLRPTSPYAASKAAADLLCLAFYRTYGVPVIIGRCTNNYGPYQYPEKFIPLIITHALQDEPIPLYGDGQQVRDWLYVEDHCEALCRLVEAGVPGEIYNVAGVQSLTNYDLIVRLLGLLGKPRSLIRPVADRPAHDRRYALDDAKLRTTLAYTPTWSFEAGLAATVEWYCAHPEWWRPLTQGEFRMFYDAWYSRL